MTLLIRLFLMGLFSGWQPKLQSLSEISRVSFRVWPTDLDILRHMNNARYFSYMEVARFSLVVRSGLLKAARKKGFFLLVGSEVIQFRRPLKLFQKFEVLTRIASMDEKWIYLEQKFERRGNLVAIGWVRVTARDARGAVSAYQMAEWLGYPRVQNEIPLAVAKWRELEKAMSDSAQRLV